MGTSYSADNKGNLINVVIGISLMIFVLMLAWFVVKILIGLAPVIGVFVAIVGGIWYLQADSERAKINALKTVIAGIGIMIVLGIIF